MGCQIQFFQALQLLVTNLLQTGRMCRLGSSVAGLPQGHSQSAHGPAAHRVRCSQHIKFSSFSWPGVAFGVIQAVVREEACPRSLINQKIPIEISITGAIMTYMISVRLVGFVCFFSFISLLHRNVAMKIIVSGLQGYTICCTIDELDEAVLWFGLFGFFLGGC